jgi:hypothetical protein
MQASLSRLMVATPQVWGKYGIKALEILYRECLDAGLRQLHFPNSWVGRGHPDSCSPDLNPVSEW